MRRVVIVVVCGLPWLAAASDTAAGKAPPIRFNRDIRPLLAENCFHCHGADSVARKGKLRLDKEEGLFEKRKEGLIVEKGKPESSLLYKRILTDVEEDMMPPPDSHKKLKAEEKELFKRWIAEGAPWEPHWAFVKPERPALPAVKNEKWIRNDIDRFVLSRLEAAGLQPAAEADPRALARRLALDLTGLPPAPEAVEAFAANKAPDAYEKYVDTLLASPHYGEHLGRYWLDAARYADTHGLHFDNFRDIWPYRDWVIEAYNRNQPFDQFTIDQLAGDLLPNPTPEQIVATGFHRCNTTTNEGGTIPEENLANYARDRVETTSWVWLGLTGNCAVCHDHKFDPITQKEFYSMSAYFRNTTQGALDGNIRDTMPVMPIPKDADRQRWDKIPAEIVAVNTAIAEKKKSLRTEFDAWVAAAKPGDWEARIDKCCLPHVLVRFDEKEPKEGAESAAGVSGEKKLEAKPTEAVKWEAGGKLGHKAPLIGGKAAYELPGELGNYEKDHAFSYGCWVKLPKDSKGGNSILAHMDDTTGFPGWDLYVEGNEFAAHLIHTWPNDAIKVVTKGKGVAKTGQWVHVFVTYNGSAKAEGFKIYVNGKDEPLKFERNELKGSTKVETPVTIGRRKTQSNLAAGSAVQDVRIYDRALTPGEVHQLAILPQMEGMLVKAAKERNPKEMNELFDAYSAAHPDIGTLGDKVAALEAEKKAIRDRSPVAYIMEEKKNVMPVANILLRGQYDKLGDKVEPAVYGVLHPMPKDAPKNRLGLAQWLASKDNPLTCRVVVNRYWQNLFGTGIVKTSEDFGTVGDAPSNQELLDYLAVSFRDGGWDTKKIIKQMVLSATYRQAPVVTPEKLEKDPADRLLSRGPRFRMDGEMVRDYALSVSGLLSPKIGGPSAKPYHPDGIWDVVGMPESNTRVYKRDTGEGLYRRSLYTFWKRAAPPASMEIFNAPTRETSCLRRERTDTPLQALVTLNDIQYVECARVLAEHVLKSGAGEDAQLDALARRVLCRPFNAKELPIVKESLAKMVAHYKTHVEDAKALIATGESKPDATIDAATLAAWTMLGNEVLNLDEVLNK